MDQGAALDLQILGALFPVGTSQVVMREILAIACGK